jgi:hypothetical protein
MKTRDIRTTGIDLSASCDVCGRTLLRGERAHPYLEGGDRRIVCELCTGRAQQVGWLKEGALPPYDGRAASSRDRRPLLRRLRRRTPAPDAAEAEGPGQEYDPPPRVAPPPRPRPVSEPRHVRAVPTSPEQRMAAAVDAFNASEFPRTIAGISRSLGEPGVTIRPAESSPSTVRILVAWELCWYRYEADLRDAPGAVRLYEQGSELDELEPGELAPNATAGDGGALSLSR